MGSSLLIVVGIFAALLALLLITLQFDRHR